MYNAFFLTPRGDQILSLTQWDLNRVLYVTDWDLDVPVFHFCNKKSDAVIPMAPDFVDGVLQVTVPNILLQEACPIVAYIYAYDDTDMAQTLKTIYIPVKERPKPEDYEYVDNTTNISMVQLDARMRNFIRSFSDGTAANDVTLELQDIRVGYDGTIYEGAGEAVRAQMTQLYTETTTIPNKALLEGNIIKFYREGGETDSLLFSADVTELMENGLNLETLSLTAAKTAKGVTLYMDDGDVTKSIELPIEVDGALSISSTNPVQNRVVTEQINNLIEELEYIKENGIGGGEGVTIRLTNQNGTSTLVGSYGSAVNVMFTFTSTEGDLPTGNANCKVMVNGVQKINMSIPQGLTSIDISPYCVIGSNSVIVTCTDIYGKARSLAYDVTIIQLSIESTFDATVPYNADILFKYTPYGAIEKTIHFVLDGMEFARVVTSLSGKQMNKTLSAMGHGTHLLEVYITATLNEVELSSEKLVYDIMCTEDGDTSAMISSAFTKKTASQGELISIPYIAYDPTKLACDITLDIYTMESGSEVIYASQELTVDRSQQYWNTRKYPVGTVYFRIKYGDIYKTHCIEVAESSIKVEAETNDLELELLSYNRSNNETNPNQWTSGEVTTTFTNVNWTSTGWVTDTEGDTCLRLNGNARAEINFKPFAEDLRVYGKTIEIEFAIRDVNNRDAIPISCMNGDIGFEIRPDMAYLKSEQSKIFCNYVEEEKIKVAFVIENKNEHRVLAVYLNGVRSDVIQYSTTDNFQQNEPVNITIGSSECGVDVYVIRSYTTALTPQAVNNNYIADITDIVKKTEAYERNDIYDEYGNVSFQKAKEKNSTMVIVGELPKSKGDKKTVVIYYYDVEDSSLNFVEFEVVIDVQGTSSQWYVTKNWKIIFNNEHYISADQMPAKVICIKVDYAEATGTHNTQGANLMHKMYSEPIPPQLTNPLVRTTIYGKPILLFHQADENSEPVFYAKANFNFDKGAENVFGFDSEVGVESWGFCNNTSDACNFLGPIPENWSDDFEARYPDKCKDISNFKVMHDWVVSTRQDTATGDALTAEYTDVDGNVHTHDTAAYRLAKFKTEFKNYFNMHYALIYYTKTFVFLGTDQRTKNMFITYWPSVRLWFFYFYDGDTILGINNEGLLIFEYYHEDTDQIDGTNVYNGQNNVLWCNFREAFADEIKETYQNLRSNGVLTFENLVDQFITNGSDKWSEAIYNEDGYVKYMSMLYSDNDASNLSQVRGTGEEHFRYIVKNRLNYCDSKWYAADYANDYISLRIYTPDTWAGIEPNANITIVPYSHMYAGVRYKANGTLYQKRVAANETVTFEAPNEKFNDTETAIYGASQISSLGDLAALYCGSINTAKATKLVILKAGDSREGYSNPNLKEVSTGTNKLLKILNVCNCPNLDTSLNLTGCPNIEEIYATGSGITSIDLVDGGILRIAQLPATIANITLSNQLYIEEFTLEGYSNVKTINIQNCPTVDSLDILGKTVNVERVRLTNVNWSYPDASALYALMERDIAGIDENGVNTDTMWIDGKCHIDNLTGNELAEIKAAFPYLEITYDTLISQLIFMSEDGNTELTRQEIINAGNGTCPVGNGTIETPTKESTAQYDFTFSGWSLKPNSDADSTALLKVEGDRYVYVAFSKAIRSYTVKFYNGTTLLETHTVEYGSDATYTGATPEKIVDDDYSTSDDFEFTGWKPSPTNIQGDTNCYAQYYDTREITDGWSTIAENCLNGTATDKYAIGSYKNLVIAQTKLPYYLSQGSAIVYNNELHILGGERAEATMSHYKYNGTEWTEVSTLPYNFVSGGIVVYNDEIHILGGMKSTTQQKHYKYNGTEWTEVSTLPYSFGYSDAVVYNNEIHILGGTNGKTNHYKFNGSEWISVSTLPYEFYQGGAVVYNDEIHILGSWDSNFHYKWNGETWTEVSTLLVNWFAGKAIVYDNEIYLLSNFSQNFRNKYYKFTGTTWIESDLPYKAYYLSATVYNNQLHILGSDSSDYSHSHYYFDGTSWSVFGEHEIIPMEVIGHNHDELADGINKWESVSIRSSIQNSQYHPVIVLDNEIHSLKVPSGATNYLKWNGSEWIEASSLPYDFAHGEAVIHDGEIHVLGGNGNLTGHVKLTNGEWVEVSTLPVQCYDSGVVEYNGEIHLIGGNGNRTGHYKWDGNEWTEVSTTPTNLEAVMAVVFNNEIYILNKLSWINNALYRWNGSEWIEEKILPNNFGSGRAIVWNNEIHVIAQNQYHYTYDGTVWSKGEKTLYAITGGEMVICNDEIHVVYGINHMKWSTPTWEKSSSSFSGTAIICTYQENNILNIITDANRYTWDGETLTEGDKTPAPFATNENHMNGFYFNGAIYAVSDTSNAELDEYGKWYQLDTDSWLEMGVLPSSVRVNSLNMAFLEYNKELHYFDSSTGHYKWDGSEWISVSTTPSSKGYKSHFVFNSEIHLVDSSYMHYKWNGTEWITVGTIPTMSQGSMKPTFRKTIVFSNYVVGFFEGSNILHKWDGTKWEILQCTGSLGAIYHNWHHWVGFQGKTLCLIGRTIHVLTNPKATLTFMAKNLLSENKQMNSTTVSWNVDYSNMELRTWLNNDLFNTLPIVLQNSICEVIKYTGSNIEKAIAKTNEKCWLISDEETGWNQLYSYVGEGRAYDIFTDNASRIRSKIGSEPEKWFVRSVYSGTTNGCGGINEQGMGYHNAHIIESLGVCFGFCL